MVVVLEGPDGGGKSTLARTLQDRYGAGRQHAGPPFPGATTTSLTRYYLGIVSGIVLPNALPYPPIEDAHFSDAESAGAYRVMRDRSLEEAAKPNALIMGSTIVDRWALGETVYGPLFRGVSLITPLAWRTLVQALDATNTPLVLCLPPKDVAMATWRARQAEGGELFADETRVAQAWELFASWALYPGAYSRPRWCWIYDYTRNNPGFFEWLDALKEKQ